MAAAAGRCGWDPCGALCPLLTYLGVGYADYAVLAHVLPQPALRGRCHREPGGGPRGGGGACTLPAAPGFPPGSVWFPRALDPRGCWAGGVPVPGGSPGTGPAVLP